MPRGYQRHCQHESRKKQRGGSSHSVRRGTRPKERQPYHDSALMEAQQEYKDYLVAQDDHDDAFSTESCSSEQTMATAGSSDQTTTTFECPICMELKPKAVKLMKICHLHTPACRDCLRAAFVVEAQNDVRNYPLRCFDPSCGRIVTAAMLEKHGLFENKNEMIKHYRLSELSKSYRGNQKVIHCPACDHPKNYKSGSNFRCRSCHCPFAIVGTTKTTKETTLRAIEAIESDDKGLNYGWAQCPACKMIISKVMVATI